MTTAEVALTAPQMGLPDEEVGVSAKCHPGMYSFYLQAAAERLRQTHAGDLETAFAALLSLMKLALVERDRLEATQTAVLNILEDGADERERMQEMQRAVLNVLSDGVEEKARLEATQKAVLNILEDGADERERMQEMQRAVLNVLADGVEEKARLEATQKAVLNILEDFEIEKNKVAGANEELKWEMAERRQTEDKLKSSNAELEQFAYVASHDLQEPLRMVSSYMALFERHFEGQLDEKARKYVYYAVDGAQRMQTLIEGLLEYSRVGRQEIPYGLVSSESALQDAQRVLGPAIAEADAVVTHDPLPDVKGHLGQLTQVFQNLLGNALKFRRLDLATQIHVAAVRRGREHLFSVTDNGIGIEPQYRERIFVIFQRLHARSEYPGTGIGLSICKKVIEHQGGRIWVESEPGSGAIFRFTLPAAERGRA